MNITTTEKPTTPDIKFAPLPDGYPVLPVDNGYEYQPVAYNQIKENKIEVVAVFRIKQEDNLKCDTPGYIDEGNELECNIYICAGNDKAELPHRLAMLSFEKHLDGRNPKDLKIAINICSPDCKDPLGKVVMDANIPPTV